MYKIPHQFESSREVYRMPDTKQGNMILFVGRNDNNKGIFYLYTLDSKYEIHLVTKGGVKRKDFIVHNNISSGELSALYERAALVVIPSRYEAFSYVALEAFAHGTPVVMSDRVMIADYLKDCKGYNTFKFGDIKDFLQAVEKTIGQSVDMDKILPQFEKVKIKASYKNVYERVINK